MPLEPHHLVILAPLAVSVTGLALVANRLSELGETCSAADPAFASFGRG